MSNRIAKRFTQLQQQGRKGLIPFCTAGDPFLEGTVQLLHTMVAAGADILEIGVPFSDPMADGPVIQRSSERALARGVSMQTVLQIVREFRSDNQDTPVILMGYMNPVETMGVADFASKAASAGVDGVLLVDLPPEESDLVLQEFAAAGLVMVFMVSPTTNDQRLKNICDLASNGSFVYYISMKGVTGAAASDIDQVQQHIERIRGYASVPVAVGFGIKDAATASLFAACADAVVVGSALVEKMEAITDPAVLQDCATTFIGSLRQAIDNAGCRQ